jgi:BirA family biotin operon repressor/biotin-[acetyl-CoA-carboxylase] ligase
LPTTLIEVEDVTSTNDWIAEQAAQGAADDLWVRAHRQSAARGRRGRAWVSTAGNLFLSGLARPRPGDGPAPQLSFAAAVAVAEALEPWLGTRRAGCKWPNDILVGGAKICGILLEAAPGGGTIIGIGVNITESPSDPERASTSIAALGGLPPGAGTLALEIVEAFGRWREIWRLQGFAPVRAAWRARSVHSFGTRIAARFGTETLSGSFQDLADDGALVLRGDDGTLHCIHAGEVFSIGAEPSRAPRATA